MMDFREIRGVVWDLDGTLYPFSDVTKKSFSLSVAQAAVAHGVSRSVEDIAAEWLVRRDEFGMGQEWQVEYGLDLRSFYLEIYRLAREDEIVNPTVGLRELMVGLEVPQGILTHGAREWVKRALRRLEIEDLFDNGVIVDLAMCDFTHKHDATLPFELILEKMELAHCPEHVVMVEDSARNLRYAKEVSMMTVLLHRGKPVDCEAYPFIDVQYGSKMDFLRSVVAVEQEQEVA